LRYHIYLFVILRASWETREPDSNRRQSQLSINRMATNNICKWRRCKLRYPVPNPRAKWCLGQRFVDYRDSGTFFCTEVPFQQPPIKCVVWHQCVRY